MSGFFDKTFAKLDPGGTYMGGNDVSFIDRHDPGGWATGTNKGSGGKKGSPTPANPKYTPPASSGGGGEMDMEAMFGMMMAMNQMNQQQSPQQLDPPKQSSYELTDWTQRKKDLRAKIAGTVKTDLDKKKGRSATVITDPLSNEDINTTKSVLT